ncbi:MAG: CehA/McbA family metallohydrolase [Kofleriaceae bacterium]|nr:CehA/McbA family metallohydrolase [Kofleriaceae bacterium]
MRWALLLALAACAAQEPETLLVKPAVATVARDADVDAAPPDAPEAPPDVPVAAVPDAPEVWLKGSTHVHARPSGDSTTPIPDVIRWYETRAYDFIVLTDHNKVSEVDPTVSSAGNVAAHAPDKGLIVLAGTELTHNPSGCIPPGDESGKCRIHVNLLGVTARPIGKIEWADRKTNERIKKYEAALVQQKQLGGIAQINHANWFWGMNAQLLAELAGRGFQLVEIANTAFADWMDGDKNHPSMDEIWDGALSQGARIWGVASDDAHDYAGKGGKYPAGGAWIVVKATREPAAILAAIAAGRFFASTGVVLARAEVDGEELVVEVAPSEKGSFTIEWIENGNRVGRVARRSARRTLPTSGYVRALVTRSDGARAWVQPAWR